MYQAYVDASFTPRSSGFGYAVFKDDILLHIHRENRVSVDCNSLEYIAVLELMKYINRIKINNVTVFTDSLNLVSELRAKRRIRNPIINEILYELSLNPTVKVKWIDRRLNVFAHSLSQNARTMNYNFSDNIKKQRRLLKTCKICKERKPVTQFPSNQRKCIDCLSKVTAINSSYLKTKLHK